MFKLGDTVKIIYSSYFGQIGTVVGIAYIDLLGIVTEIYDVEFTHYKDEFYRNVVFEDSNMLKEYTFYSDNSRTFHPTFLQLLDKQVIEGTLVLITSKVFKVGNTICKSCLDEDVIATYNNKLVKCEGHMLPMHFNVAHIEVMNSKTLC